MIRTRGDWVKLAVPSGVPAAEEDREAWRRYEQILRYSFSKEVGASDLGTRRKQSQYVAHWLRDLEHVINARLSGLRSQAFDHLKLSGSDGSAAMAAAVGLVAQTEPAAITRHIQEAISRRRLAFAWAVNSYAVLQGKDDGRGPALEASILQAGGLGSLAVAVGKWGKIERAVGALVGYMLESEKAEALGRWPTFFTTLSNNKNAIPGAVAAWSAGG